MDNLFSLWIDKSSNNHTLKVKALERHFSQLIAMRILQCLLQSRLTGISCAQVRKLRRFYPRNHKRAVD
jgi:hypothetical protein